MSRSPLFDRSIRTFLTDTNGGISVEFVIILPAFLLLLLILFVTSMTIATASEVQQLAHEMTRASVTYLHPREMEPDFCDRLTTEVADRVVPSLVMLDAGLITQVRCDLDAPARLVSVEVAYRMQDTSLFRMGQSIGVAVPVVVRSSMMRF